MELPPAPEVEERPADPLLSTDEIPCNRAMTQLHFNE
jgi:hypothetical protein